jgi:hypothetical protein
LKSAQHTGVSFPLAPLDFTASYGWGSWSSEIDFPSFDLKLLIRHPQYASPLRFPLGAVWQAQNPSELGICYLSYNLLLWIWRTLLYCDQVTRGLYQKIILCRSSRMCKRKHGGRSRDLRRNMGPTPPYCYRRWDTVRWGINRFDSLSPRGVGRCTEPAR